MESVCWLGKKRNKQTIQHFLCCIMLPHSFLLYLNWADELSTEADGYQQHVSFEKDLRYWSRQVINKLSVCISYFLFLTIVSSNETKWNKKKNKKMMKKLPTMPPNQVSLTIAVIWWRQSITNTTPSMMPALKQCVIWNKWWV